MQAVIRIKGYDSLEQIAVGGMAVVYKARKQSLKKSVAIKVLLPHLAGDTRFITRFQREAETAARVQHDNIVNVLDYGKSDQWYYIVMEYYDGVTVEELLRSCPRLPLDIAMAIILSICYGLEAAHAQGLVHRDVKPANIILTRQGGVKIADFGLAKDVEKFTLVTQVGKVFGTPAYMSPEQTRGETVGTASDIFSLGAVAYEMLTAQRPFDGSSYSEVVDRIQNYKPPTLKSINPLVESRFESIVTRMLAKTTKERYERVEQVIADLSGAIEERGFRTDRRTLASFLADPDAYAESAAQAARDHPAPQAGESGPAVAFKFGKRPEPKPAEAPAPKAPKAPAADKTADYRVILESIDREVETVDSFALKLAMRLKSPVPRMRLLVSRAPCTMAQYLPYKKARWLASIIEELGGSGRIEVIPEQPRPEPVSKPAEEAKPAPASEAAAQAEAVGSPRGKSGLPGIVCPRCGWEEDAHAKFCSLCLTRFNKTEKIDVTALNRPGFADPNENPHDAAGPVVADPVGDPPRTIHWLSARNILIVTGLLILVPILIVAFRR